MNEQQIKTSHIDVQIETEGGLTPFVLDLANRHWHSSRTTKEADFPLITVVDGKRYELYSDGTSAEVEK